MDNSCIYICTQLMVEGIYILALLDTDTSRRSDVMKKFTEVAIDHSDHLQPGYVLLSMHHNISVIIFHYFKT